VGPDRLRRIAAVAMLINPFSVFHVLIDLVIVPSFCSAAKRDCLAVAPPDNVATDGTYPSFCHPFSGGVP
jgi:hypothetical protein